jgi:serine protease Do
LPALVGLLAIGLALATPGRGAQEPGTVTSKLPRSRYRSGDQTLHVFAPVSDATRHSIVKLKVDGKTAALGTVMDTNGLILTKASELKQGKLTCWLAVDKEVDAQFLGAVEQEDLALVRVHTSGLKPIQWAAGDVTEGQWAITPGIGPTPHAVGIISALPRRIRPERAFIGVRFDYDVSAPKVGELLPGLGAEKAGLKPGDVILSVNLTGVTNREQVVDMLREFRAGQTVNLGVLRDTRRFDVKIQMMVPTSDATEAGSSEARRSPQLNGEISQRAQGFEKAIEHDTVLAPWLCGGPLVNLEGKAIGLNIARASRVTTFALPSKLVLRVFDELKSRFARPASQATEPGA